MPYPPGGPIDTLARLIAQEAAADLKQPVVVENRPGASGIVGTGAVARAEPDGYTLILGTNQTHATNQSLIKSWTFDAVKDFSPVAGVAAMPHVLVVRKDFAANSVGDVVAMAKAKPGALTFGSMGNGSGAHLAAELFKTKAGIDMLHVPYKGLAPMTTELLAGRVDLSIAPLPGLIAQQIASGNVRALGIASAQRTPQLDTVPTFAEAGVAGVEADAWSALFAPAEDAARGDRSALQSRGGRAGQRIRSRQPRAPGPAGGAEDAGGDVRHAAGRGGEMGGRHQARECDGGVALGYPSRPKCPSQTHCPMGQRVESIPWERT